MQSEEKVIDCTVDVRDGAVRLRASPGARILENIASSVSDEVKSGKTKASPEEEPDESQVADEAGGAQTAQEPVPEQEPAMEQEAGQETGSGEYERGTVTQDAWESEFWNLRFTPPQGLSMLGEEELNSMMGLGEEMLSQNFSEKQVEYAQMMNVYEMMSSNLTGDANVVVTTEKLLASGFSSEDYLQAMKKPSHPSQRFPIRCWKRGRRIRSAMKHLAS